MCLRETVNCIGILKEKLDKPTFAEAVAGSSGLAGKGKGPMLGKSSIRLPSVGEKRKSVSILAGPIEKFRLGENREVLPSTGSNYHDANEDVLETSSDDSDMEDDAFVPENASGFMYPKNYIKHIAKKAAARAAASVKRQTKMLKIKRRRYLHGGLLRVVVL